nr:chitinase-like protein 1 [Quercus suber]
MQKMEYRPLLTLALILLVLVNCPKFSSSQKLPCENRACSKTKCCQDRGQCNTITYRCCDGAVTDYLQSDQFENMFSNRNSLEAHAKGFWDYQNYNYGEAGKDLKVDLLNHPEYIEQNATLAFQVAIWRWMTPIMGHQPSAHDVIIGLWKPTKNDFLAKRVSGFGATMNVLYGDLVCGQGDNESMNNIISHYLDLMGVGQEEAGPHEVVSRAEQIAFNPSSSLSP